MREAFEQWWSHYPKRVGCPNPKQPAWEVWQRLAKSGTLPSLPELIDAADRYGAYCKRERIEPKFIAHARTWLNQQRWEEFVTTVSQNVTCGQPNGSKENTSVPAIMAPVFKALGDERYLQQFSSCQFEDRDGVLVIRSPYRFMLDRIQDGLVSRLTGRRVLVEVAA